MKRSFLDRYRERKGELVDVRVITLTIQILNQLKLMLSGYKTYIVGTLAILTSVGTYLAGMITLPEMLAGVFAAVQSMNLRDAINTSAKK